jgi:hypothetical protein
VKYLPYNNEMVLSQGVLIKNGFKNRKGRVALKHFIYDGNSPSLTDANKQRIQMAKI